MSIDFLLLTCSTHTTQLLDLNSHFWPKIALANVIFPLKDRRAVNLERIGVKSVCSNYSTNGNPIAAEHRSGQQRLKIKNADRNRRMSK